MSDGQIESGDGWTLLGGQPIPYLDALRNSRNSEPFFLPGRAPWPHGKRAVDRFLAQHGGPLAVTFGFIRDGRVAEGTLAAGQSAGALLRQLPAGNYFCKPD